MAQSQINEYKEKVISFPMEVIKLRILGVVADEIVGKLMLVNEINFPKDLVFLFVDYSEFDVELGTRFSSFSPLQEDSSFKVNLRLNYVTIETFQPLVSIDYGYKTICGFECEGDKDWLSKLSVMDSWFGDGNPYYLS